MLYIISHVIRIDQNIIKIDYYTNIKKIRKDVIHKVLEGDRSVGETKEHKRLFEWSVVGVKHSLPFITFSNTD